jgi:hypothetical protein
MTTEPEPVEIDTALYPDATPEAPFGYKADGSPYKRRPPARRPTAPDGPLSLPKATQRPRAARGTTDYREGISGLMQLVAMPLAVAGLKNKALAADASAIAIHTPPIAEALNDLAMTHPEVAAALDHVLAVGPYGAIFAAVLPLGMQIALNHGVLPLQVGQQMGLTNPADLVRTTPAPPAPEPEPEPEPLLNEG